MNIFELVIALGISAILTLLFAFAFRLRGPWGSLWTFFLVLALSIVAADLWLSPVGPYWFEVPWIPMLFVGLVIALILAAASPRGHQPTDKKETRETENKEARVAIMSVLLWTLILLLTLSVVLGITQ